MFTVVVSAIIRHNNKFLVIKRSRDSEIHPGLWALPGGRIEEGETIFHALKREVKEETNLDILSDIKYIADYIYPRPDKTKTIGLSFLTGLAISKSRLIKKVTKNGQGISDIKWITLEELDSLDMQGYIKEEILRASAET